MLARIYLVSRLSEMNDGSWTFPEIIQGTTPIFSVKEAFLPLLQTADKAAVKNSFHAHGHYNSTILLSGVNGSGKSSLFQTFALSTVLAQAGFPVPATHMTICPFRSLIFSTTPPDDISKGYSSYIAELNELQETISLASIRKPSLVFLDDFLKSTALADSLSLMWSSIEFLSEAQDILTIVSLQGRELVPMSSLY